MLAVQMHDGDLRVWSVSKSYNAEEPKVVRALRRNENYQAGPNWMGWSKNGRVIQFSDSYVPPLTQPATAYARGLLLLVAVLVLTR